MLLPSGTALPVITQLRLRNRRRVASYMAAFNGKPANDNVPNDPAIVSSLAGSSEAENHIPNKNRRTRYER